MSEPTFVTRAFSWWLTRRRLALLAVTAISLVLGAFASRVHPDYSVEHFFPSWSDARSIYDRFKADFPHDDTKSMVIVEGPDIYTPAGLARMRRLEDALSNLPHVSDVEGPCSTKEISGDETGIDIVDLFPEDLDPRDIPARKKTATTDPMFRWNLAKPDGTAVTIRVILEPRASATDKGRREFTEAAQAAVEPFRHEGWRIVVSGNPAIRAEVARMVRNDLVHLLPLVFVIVLAILFAAYRSVGAMLAGFVTIVTSVVWSVGVMGIFGHPFTMLSSILPIVVTIISLSDTVHIVNDFFARRREGMSVYDSLVDSMSHSAGPCLATEVVIACGFFSLLGVNIVGVIQFGTSAAIAMLATWLANMTVLPLALSLVRRPLPQQASGGARTPGMVAAFARFVEWIGRQTTQRPRLILLVAGVLLAIGGASATRVSRQAFVFDDLRPDAKFTRDLRYAEATHGGLVQVAIYVEPVDPGAAENSILEPETVRLLDRAAAMLESFPEIAQANSVADHLRKGYRIFAGGEVDEPDGLPSTRALNAQLLMFIDQDEMVRDYVSFDRTSAAAIGYAKDVGSIRVAKMFGKINAWVAAEQARIDAGPGPKVKVSATGQLRIFHDVNQSLVSRAVASFGAAVVATLVVFCIVLRSIPLGLIGILPNIAPMLLTIAFMAITGITLRPSTVIMFSIILVIADDDTMQYLARLRGQYARARDREPPGTDLHRAAALGAMRESGLPMFVTSTAVSMGFLLLVFSELRGTAELGVLIGVTLFFAIFADLFLAPILVTKFRPRL